MEVTIRQEKESDFTVVEALVKAAFAAVEYSDQTEHELVARLRNSGAFVPGLSLVAELDGRVVGHILLTEIDILDGDKRHQSLALAPVSVWPDQQGKGIGGQLIHAAHHEAKALGYRSIVLIGHAAYYPRFGYQKASQFGISVPFEVPDENCLALALTEDGLLEVNGMVSYAPEFGL